MTSLQSVQVDFVSIPTQKIHTQPACRLNTLFTIIDLAGANLAQYRKMSHPSSSSPEPPVFIAHPLCHPHLRTIVEDAVEATP
jgi:hypothetical protein